MTLLLELLLCVGEFTPARQTLAWWVALACERVPALRRRCGARFRLGLRRGGLASGEGFLEDARRESAEGEVFFLCPGKERLIKIEGNANGDLLQRNWPLRAPSFFCGCHTLFTILLLPANLTHDIIY